MRFSLFVSAAAFCGVSIAGYVLEDDYMTDFYGNFDFFCEEDPTNGFVKYVDEATARQSDLIHTSTNSSVRWGADSSNKTPDGRPSLRINSKKTYTHALVVLDVAHMPFGCGIWPAFWTVGPDWPSTGEIDILEGVNDQAYNGMTLHTGPNCNIGSDTSLFAGDVTTPDCNVNADGQDKNVGCSIKDPSTSSYGAGLNAINGGVFATEWTADAISVYFFPRGSVPEDVLGDAPNPSTWGTPSAKFTGGCDIGDTFKDHQIVFDTTFCGDWAGAIWDEGSCATKAATCEEWVRDNPEAFADAYWEINALRVYKTAGETDTPGLSSSVSTLVPISTKTKTKTKTTPMVSVSTGRSSGYPVVSAPTKSRSKVVDPLPTSTAVQLSTSKAASSGRPVSSSKVVVTSTSKTVASVTSGILPTSSSAVTKVPSSSPVLSVSTKTTSTLPVSSISSTPSTPSTPSTKPAATPTGQMSGFQWPKAVQQEHQQQPLATNDPQPTSPILNTSTSTSTSTTTTLSSQKDILEPSLSTSTPPTKNVEIKTVYETIYATAPTPTVTATKTAIAMETQVQTQVQKEEIEGGEEGARKRARRHVEERKRKRGFGGGHARL